jgi:hypothetical protein
MLSSLSDAVGGYAQVPALPRRIAERLLLCEVGQTWHGPTIVGLFVFSLKNLVRDLKNWRVQRIFQL